MKLGWVLLNIFLNSLFSLVLYLVRFNTNNKNHFHNNLGKISVLKDSTAQAFEARRDCLNIFLRFLGFWGSFSHKTFSYKKKLVSKINSFFVIFLLNPATAVLLSILNCTEVLLRFLQYVLRAKYGTRVSN